MTAIIIKKIGMNNLERIVKFGLFASCLQIAVYAVIMYIWKFLQPFFLHQNNKEIVRDQTFLLAIIFFSLIVLVQNLTAAKINNNKFDKIAFGLAAISYMIPYYNHGFFSHYTAIIFIIVGLTILVSKFFIEKQIKRR